MGASDFDALSFVPQGHKVIGIKAHCLDGLSHRFLGWRAWLHQQLAPLLDRQEPFRLVHTYLQRVAMLQSNDGKSFCGWAGLPLTLLGVLRLSRDGSDLL